MQEGVDACGARRSPLQARWPPGCEAEACGKLANDPGSGPAPTPHPQLQMWAPLLSEVPGRGPSGHVSPGTVAFRSRRGVP